MGNILGKRNGETRLNCFENSIAKFQEEHDYYGELNFLSIRNDNPSISNIINSFIFSFF